MFDIPKVVHFHPQIAGTLCPQIDSSTNVNTNVNIGTNGSGTGGIPVEIDTEEESIYTVSGVSIEITNIRGSSIDYVLFDDGTSYGVRGQNVRKY